MTKEEVINEIAKDLCSQNKICTCSNRDGHCSTPQQYAHILYNLNYHKQTEAEWEEYQVPHIIVCSECDWGTDPRDRKQFKYCPNCGAKMVGRK